MVASPLSPATPLSPTPAWASDVAEPFRSDRLFWKSVTASADAVAALVLAVAGSVLLRLGSASALFCLLPFVVPSLLLVRAGLAGRASSLASRRAFAGAEDALQAWRLAERSAVARVFLRALVRNRFSAFA